MKSLIALFAALGLSIAPAAAQTRDSAEPALWVVQDEDTTIFLFGSVHVLKPDTVWFDDDVKAAFDRSDEVMLEVVEPDPRVMQATVIKLAIDPDGPPLSQKLTAEARTKYQRAMNGVGIPWEAFEKFEPWMAALTLAVAPLAQLGYSDAVGVEKVVTRAAQAAGKPISGLETVEGQLGLFDTLPEDQQIAFLNATVDEMGGMEEEFTKLIADWSAGRPEALAALMNDSMEATPEIAQVLLFNRNANWAKQIKARMEKPGTVFIAVGAGHLAGAKSVQDQLKALGIKSQRIDMKWFEKAER